MGHVELGDSGDDRLHARLLEAVARLGTASTRRDFAEAACRELLGLVPGLWATFVEVDLDSETSTITTWPEQPAAWHESYAAAHGTHGTHGAEDPGLHQLTIPLPSGSRTVVTMSVSRSGAEFGARDHEVAVLWRPHMTNLLELYTWRERARVATSLMASEGWKAAVVDPSGVVLAATEAATLLGESIGATIRAGEPLAGTHLWSVVTSDHGVDVHRIESAYGGVDVQAVRDHGRWRLLLRRVTNQSSALERPSATGSSGLSVEDQESVLEAIGAIGQAVTLEGFARAACRELYRLVPGVWVSYNETNLLTARTAAFVWPERSAAWFDQNVGTFERYAQQNPLVRHISRDGESDVRTLLDLDPDRTFEQTDLFRHYYAPNGIRSQAAFGLPAPPGVVIALVVNRDGADFTTRDRRVMEVLRLHLSNIYRMVAAYERARGMSTAVQLDGWETILLADDGTVIESTPAAEEIGRQIGLGLRVGDSLLGTTLWEQPTRSSQGEQWWSVKRVPSTALEVADGAFDASLTVSPVGPHVLLLRPAHGATVESAMRLGLTRRQAQVALLIVDGATNAQIARALDISPGTARKHVEQLMGALGVSSRGSAAVAVMRGR